MADKPPENSREFSHYFKKTPFLHVDVYRVLELFNVRDAAIAHAVKKLLAPGNRGAKSVETDVREAMQTLQRWLEMRVEDQALGLAPMPAPAPPSLKPINEVWRPDVQSTASQGSSLAPAEVPVVERGLLANGRINPNSTVDSGLWPSGQGEMEDGDR